MKIKSKNIFFIFALFMVLLCCFSAVSASEDVTDDISAISDDIAVDEVVSEVDSADESITASNDEDLESVDDSVSDSLAVQDEEQVNDVEEVDSTLTAEDDNGQTPKLGAVLGVASMDLIGDSESTIFVNSSCDHDYDDDDEMDGSSWETALGTDDPLQWIPELTTVTGIDNIININMANGEYTDLGDFPTNINYIGFGDNVIIKANTIGQKSKTDNKYNYLFKNLIFENAISFEGRHFTFVNCTFNNVNLDFYKQIENENFMQKFDVDSDEIDVRPLFRVNFDNCRFVDCDNVQIIDAHKYSNLTIENCNFTSCNVNCLVSTNANYTYSDNENEIYKYEKGIKDGVNIVNINVADSIFKGVLKAQKDSNYSVEKVSGINPTADIIEEGNNIYLNATDIKSPVETILNINSTEKGIIVITVVDNDNNPISNIEVKYTVNGGEEQTVTTGEDGKATITGLTGEVTIAVNYEGNESFKPISDSKFFNFTEEPVVPAKVATKITAPKVSAVYNVAKNLVITLTDKNGKALANKKVSVKVGSISKTLTTNAKGQVSLNVATLVPKTYTATVKFAGDDGYLASSVSPKVVVSKAKAKIAAKAKTFKVKVKTKKYTVTLKNNKGKVMKKVKLTLKVGKKTYKATTNAKGKATFKITKLSKKGKYTATVKFAGSKYYKALSKKVKITVKK